MDKLDKYFNQVEPFDHLQKDYLGKYVYLLINPNSKSVFYVGQGTKERVGDHFNNARADMIKGKESEKTREILSIWRSEKFVDIAIARRGLRDNKEADNVEGALKQTLDYLDFNLTNKIEIKSTKSNGWMSLEDVRVAAAPSIAVNKRLENIHFFNISKSLAAKEDEFQGISNKDIYFEALRRSWYKGNKVPNTGIAVGYVDNPAVSVIVCKIRRWHPCQVNSGLWQIEREINLSKDELNIIDQLKYRNLSKIIKARKGAKHFAKPVQIEFDGMGKFRFSYGIGDKKTWHLL